MKFSLFSLLIATAIVLGGCSTDSSLDSPVTTASALDKTTAETQTAYQYFGYSRDGSVVVRGTLTVSISAAGRVTGTWEFRGLDPARIGPQVGRGALTGTMANGVLSLNLNPRNVDNNVLLNGRLNRNEYVGRWEWVGLRGVLNGGTFRAGRGIAEAVAD